MKRYIFALLFALTAITAFAADDEVDLFGLPTTNRVYGTNWIPLATQRGVANSAKNVQIDAIADYVVSQVRQSPFQFPMSGNIKNQMVDFATVVTNGVPVTIFNATGSGVVRTMQIVIDATDNILYFGPDLFLNVQYDGRPAMSIPWGYLMGYVVVSENRDYTSDSAIKSTNIVAYSPSNGVIISMVTNSTLLNVASNNVYTPFWNVMSHGGPISAFTLKYPIPYTNGCTVWFSCSPITTKTYRIASQVQYQDYLPSSWNQNLRWKFATFTNTTAAYSDIGSHFTIYATNPTRVIADTAIFTTNSVGKYVVTGTPGANQNIEWVELLVTNFVDSTNADVYWGQLGATLKTNITPANSYWAWANKSTFLAVTNGKGYLAGIFGQANTYNPSANIHIFINSNTVPEVEWSATEDFFGGSYMFTMSQSYHDDVVGLTLVNGKRPAPAGPYQFSGYHLFYNDPIRFTNGIYGRVNNLNASPVSMTWAAVWYEEQ